MRYEIKAILKNKLTWILFFIIMVISLMTYIKLENRINNEEYAKDLDWNAVIIENNIRNEQSGFSMSNNSKSLELWFNNYIAYEQWIVDNYRMFATQHREYTYKEKDFQVFDLLNTLANMNLNSLGQDNDLEIYKLYEDKLVEYATLLKIDELPFKLHELTSNPYSMAEDKMVIYKMNKTSCDYSFYLLDNNERNISTYTPSPISFVSVLLSENEYTSIIIGVLIILFSTAIMAEMKQNASNRLIALVPRRKISIFNFHFVNILSVITIVVGVSILIPTLVLGIRYGFPTFNYPVLVDMKGFRSLTGYEHIDSMTYFGISRVYAEQEIPGYYVIISDKLSYMPLWKFLIASSCISILKVTSLTAIGIGIGLFIKKHWVSLLSSIGVTVAYIISQYSYKHMKWNPLSIKSGWDVASGWTNMTWFKSMMILIPVLIIIYMIMIIISNKKDFN